LQTPALHHKTKTTDYTVGICTSGNDRYLAELVQFMKEESNDSAWRLKEIIIVASEPSPNSLALLNDISIDPRFRIVLEEERRGKFEAINRILELCSTEYLVLVNGDALPARGSIVSLLKRMSSDDKLAVVSSIPIVEYDGGMATGIIALIWSVHNELLKTLSEDGSNRHSCDELMIVRKSRISKLPYGTVNDGAYMSCYASLMGYGVSYSSSSYVIISTPKRLADVVRQRRRIVFGHLQVWKTLGIAPTTAETTIFTKPLVAIKVLAEAIRKEPRLLISLFAAIVEEVFSSTMGLIDFALSSRRHSVWKRYES